jgi:hypothetical protein
MSDASRPNIQRAFKVVLAQRGLTLRAVAIECGLPYDRAVQITNEIRPARPGEWTRLADAVERLTRERAS